MTESIASVREIASGFFENTHGSHGWDHTLRVPVPFFFAFIWSYADTPPSFGYFLRDFFCFCRSCCRFSSPLFSDFKFDAIHPCEIRRFLITIPLWKELPFFGWKG